MATAEPKIDDINPDTGGPKYSTYEEYARDLRVWDRREAVSEYQRQQKAKAPCDYIGWSVGG